MENIIFDPQRMFEHACAFVDCARSCEIEPNNIKYRMQSHTVSGIVNSAFACEVFIKSLLVFNDMPAKELRGHELKKLWSAFKEKDYKTAVSVEEGMRTVFNSENENMFNELLDEISNAFEYWRYIYEKDTGSINYNFLVYFRNLLREVSCRLINGKSWNEYIKSD
jgi:hypothetical protein